MDLNTKREIINPTAELPITVQCDVLSLARSSAYYKPADPITEQDLEIMNMIDQIYTEHPYFGHRRIRDELKDEYNMNIGRHRVRQYMNLMGIEAFYPRRKINTSTPNKEHKVYPYLLRKLDINRCNQVWAADITYIPLNGKFCYLVAIIDWYSRCILSYRISNSLDTSFCLDALNEALDRYEKPEIFNTDQGSQFTSEAFTKKLIDQKILISMDSVGRAIDNIIIERFFRTLKYEDIYLNRYVSIKELKQGVDRYMKFYNHKRRHSSLEKQTPFQVYRGYAFCQN